MTVGDRDTPLCARVFERLMDDGDVGGDRVLSEHLRSCVTCFRTLTELRDAPRLAEALRGATSATPELVPSDRFWEDLAVRTASAVSTALSVEGPLVAAPGIVGSASRPPSATVGPRGRRWSVSARTRTIFAATAVAAVATFAVVERRPAPIFSSRTPAPRASGGAGTIERAAPDDDSGEAAADVADLDGMALRRLLDRLRAHAPAVLTAAGASDSGEPSDALDDDDRRVNDELADLDGMALRRVASSLGASSL
jgi:hypothetical protein